MKTIWDWKGRRKRVPFELGEIRELEMFPRHEKQNRVASNTEITRPQAQFARQTSCVDYLGKIHLLIFGVVL